MVCLRVCASVCVYVNCICIYIMNYMYIYKISVYVHMNT